MGALPAGGKVTPLVSLVSVRYLKDHRQCIPAASESATCTQSHEIKKTVSMLLRQAAR